jgi:hypothetical protein
VEEEVPGNGGWAKNGEAEEPARVAGESAAGRMGTRRSEKAKVSEEALLTRGSKAKKPMNACVHTYTKSQTPTRRHMLGPERPEAVPLDRALYLPTFSHL